MGIWVFVIAAFLAGYIIRIIFKKTVIVASSRRLHTPPKRPFLLRLYNQSILAVWDRLGDRGKEWLGLSLKPESIIVAAVKTTGYSDFGPKEEWDKAKEGLKIFLESCEKEAKLNPFGILAARQRLIASLSNRLRTQEIFKRHPEILQQEINNPLVIVGLPRTGTTLLHRLIATDERMRAVGTWESLDPAPSPTKFKAPSSSYPREMRWDFWNQDARVTFTFLKLHMIKLLAPEFWASHPAEVLAPEEDVVLQDGSFLSQLPEAIYRVPTYSKWVEKQDHRLAYRYLKKMLQLLQWQYPGIGKPIRWVLKTPAHAEWIEVLFEVFPQAQVIHTHRDPSECDPSFYSMISHAYRVFSDDVDPSEIARHWFEKHKKMLARMMAIRKSDSKETRDKKFIDVYYEDITKSPMKEMEKVYQFAGMEFKTEVRKAMETSLTINVQHKYGKHEYWIEDFHMKLETLLSDQVYQSYCNKFLTSR